jgi:ankyrin repeat protein
MWAVVPGQPAILELLLKHGADLNAKANNGSTALTWATAMGQLDAVKMLRAHGTEAKSADAVLAGDKGEVERLLKGGSDPNVNDDYGSRLLRLAEETGHPELLTLLNEPGAVKALQ